MGQMVMVDEDCIKDLYNWAAIGKDLVRRINFAVQEVLYPDIPYYKGPTVANVAHEQLSMIIDDAKKYNTKWWKRSKV